MSIGSIKSQGDLERLVSEIVSHWIWFDTLTSEGCSFFKSLKSRTSHFMPTIKGAPNIARSALEIEDIVR